MHFPFFRGSNCSLRSQLDLGEKLFTQIKAEIASYGGVIDCGIIPEPVSIFDQIVRPEKTDYYIAGPMGPARVNNEAQGKFAGEWDHLL